MTEQKAQGTEVTQLIQSQMALKRRLIDFVMDAEDEVATALEAFSAQQLSRWAKPALSGVNRTALAVDMFTTEGTVTYEENGIVTQKTAAYVFGQSENVSSIEQEWLNRWLSSFNGLFVVTEGAQPHYRLTNWLTQKQYSVTANSDQASEVLGRLKDGEMIVARLMPITNSEWTFSGPLTLLGKLGKPKLAVAIGNFRQWFPAHLYGDAPELKEAAWASVKAQHADFVELFGAQKVLMPGHELNKQLQAYQAQSTEKKLAEAGLDSSKSLKDLAQDAGVSKEEMTEAVESMGTEGKVAANLIESQKSLKMVMPKVELPEDLRRADRVTAFAHPRWGQTFLKDYARLEELLQANEETEAIDQLVLKHLENERAIAPLWHQLAADYGQPLESALRRILKNDAFDIEQDLDGAIARYGKALTPTLPDTASVPEHLHDLFQEALKAVGKDAKKQSGKKKAKKKKSGFGA
ncbi:MAG: hypothetical protein ACFB16_20070 [Phormidesmis sp.]